MVFNAYLSNCCSVEADNSRHVQGAAGERAAGFAFWRFGGLAAQLARCGGVSDTQYTTRLGTYRIDNAS